ncbi:multidrug resistance protein [Thermoplasma volcanium GSS1]|uniref:Multidrug resistance protein n=1 Tax=Thermoplasma volcanium (strain ATCC 51530 / DSM 4299 / JCM 9571 / NBRC 15438 / GSS1) TaxID=273116 RepID=Q979Q7_THEVO|nr:multidrug resistance protein [Thermoplasma volcanium GSS1]
MTTSFYIGLALFQLVGGSLAHRIGNLKVSFIGLTILGTFGITSGLSSNFLELAISRFMAGVGSALFFSPALGIISDIVPPEKYGSYVSIYNGAFSFGAGAGIFAFGYFDTIIGWRLSLIIGGLLLYASDIAMVIALHGEEHRARGPLKDLAVVAKNPVVWILPVLTIGSAISETIMGQLFVYYLERFRYVPVVTASAIGSFFLFFGLPGGFISGMMIRKYQSKYAVTGFFIILASIFFMIPYEYNFAEILASVALFSVLSIYGFSYLYTVTSLVSKKAVSFSLSIVNFVQMIISAAVPYVYTYTIDSSSIYYAWYVMGIISLIPSLFILYLKINISNNK